ncbi:MULTISPECIES: DUF6368 family protein [Streptomyces]|uniref:DUF6368 family protein n=1 Tax=Streptomyces TaxID=1883 RepID=UPI00067C5E4C|nr:MULTISPECIES: DUF6368 family protein [Streptomyces]KND43111.1 hypothetical protein IQ64_19970 [Streptomyces stelliscabiei]MDX2516890.1 DUF6368 family protein [Streptomyces stelliscabiei]MDX2550633.1 DUF6368 family protein [Streptomyces stelliscabiei]MDX2610331.1 DUF6368 family protein [Streptomyces stelliscabiei]MDX2634748.1 DUF6368 family protein [Streptomyces stelliscabiei]
MSGPTLVIDLAEPLSPSALQEFRALMVGLSSHFAEKRPGFFDVNVPAERLGVQDRREEDWRKPFPLPLLGNTPADEELTALVGFNPQREDWRRPFLVYLMGPGIGDESIFQAEHADEPEVEAVLGFRPTHAVNVSACCNREIDHVTTALLTAAVMDVIGGVAKAELLDGQVSVVAGLPGVLGITDDDWTVLGTAEFLRAWVGQPAFRLVK